MPIRVLIVDDSALIREIVAAFLATDPEIEVVGTASDALIARQKIKTLNPDVLTLDIEMPHMDGLSFLEKIMSLRPMPVVMVSSLTQRGAEASIRALELGAVDCVGKPLIEIREGMELLRDELIAKVKIAAQARIMPLRSRTRSAERLVVEPKVVAENHIIAIGASTGGVEALTEILSVLPAETPAILVTQHMPPVFTASFAKRLDSLCAMSVVEARHGERVMAGHVYLAPGGQHLELVLSGGDYFCRVHDGPPISGHRPSVDALFNSVAAYAKQNATGVILTGMGRDGAAGLLAMRQAGAHTIGQDENSSLVYGMPKAAHLQGAVEIEAPLQKIAQMLLR